MNDDQLKALVALRKAIADCESVGIACSIATMYGEKTYKSSVMLSVSAEELIGIERMMDESALLPA